MGRCSRTSAAQRTGAFNEIPFTKAHGAQNDFLLTWEKDAPEAGRDALARAICDRHAGVGADGWMLVSPPAGRRVPMAPSSSTTRMAARRRFPATARVARRPSSSRTAWPAATVRIRTGAGVKTLRLLERNGREFEFEMDMGRPAITAERLRPAAFQRAARRDAVVRWGTRSAPFPVTDFDFDWRAMGARNRAAPALPQPHQRLLREAPWTALHRRALLGARRGRNHELGNRLHGRGRHGRGARLGEVSGDACSRRRGRSMFAWKDDVYLTGPAQILVAEGEFLLGE